MESNKLPTPDITRLPIQALAYAGAGAIGTACHWIVMIALLRSDLVSIVVASTIGSIVGGLINYELAHRRVFMSEVRHAVALPRFAAVALFGVALNAAVLAAVVASSGAIVGQLIASGAVLISGYILNRNWSFRA